MQLDVIPEDAMPRITCGCSVPDYSGEHHQAGSDPAFAGVEGAPASGTWTVVHFMPPLFGKG